MSSTASRPILDQADPGPGRSLYVIAQDGLRLHVREYGGRLAERLPVVCLPGLARTCADFETLAVALSEARDRPRRVLAFDYRGRGRSDYDRNPQNYSIAMELADTLAVLTALGVGPALFIGTSRGGLLTMALGVARPTAIAGAVLNDIGPVIEPKGLLRIKGYVGKLPQPKSFQEGAEILRRLFDAQFPKLDAADWLASARRTWVERNERLVTTYDVRLADTLQGLDLERPLPTLWKEFDTLGRLPLMVIRGANSDLLTAATVTEMAARRASMSTLVVPDQGHAPLLAEPDVIKRIVAFAADCDEAGPG